MTHNPYGPVSSMTWDADSNRISFTSSTGGTWQFVYDVTAGIPAVIEEVTPSGSVYYVRESNGALIARIAGGSVSYYHFDALGSTRLLTDASGNVTDTYTYDAWGNLTGHTGTTNQPYQYVGQLGYYTHTQDENMDLLQLGVRFYDPETGRFMQVDPAPGFTVASHVYSWDRPTLWVDPGGRKPYDKVNPDELAADYKDVGRCGTWCAGAVRRLAKRFVGRAYPKEDIFGDNLANAVLHCTWTCMIAKYCGRDVAVAVTNNHEKYNWNPRTGPMDLANNKEGLDCFDRGEDCLECCKRKRKDRGLHLPPKKPVPDYPGGIK